MTRCAIPYRPWSYRKVRLDNRLLLRAGSLVVVTVFAALLLRPAGTGAVGSGLYQPQRADFPCQREPAYGKGDCDAYFKWIETFYRGTLFTKGWTEYAARLLSPVSEDARPRLVDKINRVGRTIAAEWAKENGYRHIHSTRSQGYPNMQDLVDRLNETVKADTGDGKVVEAFLDTAQRVAEKAIRGEQLSDTERVWK